MSGAWLALFIGMWVFCIFLATLVLGLSHRISSLEEMVSAGSSGGSDPSQQLIGEHFEAHAIASGVASATGAIAGVVLFVSEQCGPCQTLAANVRATLANAPAKSLDEAVQARVTVVTNETGMFDELGATAVLVDPTHGITQGFGVTATPVGIALNHDGVVMDARIVGGFQDLKDLATATTGSPLNVIMSA